MKEGGFALVKKFVGEFALRARREGREPTNCVPKIVGTQFVGECIGHTCVPNILAHKLVCLIYSPTN
jgi:hypothetical protein